MLAEDNERILQAGRDILESLGYRVLTAANGREALEIHQAEEVDLVLTDIVMPEMGGAALVQELRKANPHLKAMVITGHPFTENLEKLKETGIVDVVHKPLEVSTLAQAVRNALDAD